MTRHIKRYSKEFQEEAIRQQKDQAIVTHLKEIPRNSKSTYGYQRMRKIMVIRAL